MKFHPQVEIKQYLVSQNQTLKKINTGFQFLENIFVFHLQKVKIDIKMARMLQPVRITIFGDFFLQVNSFKHVKWSIKCFHFHFQS